MTTVQALMDVARQQLVSNRQRLQGLSQQAGCQLPESADVYADFSQVLTEWNAQVSAHRPLPGKPCSLHTHSAHGWHNLTPRAHT